MKNLIFDFLSCVWEGMEDALIQFSKLRFWSGVHSNVLSRGCGFEHHIVWCFAEKYFENVLKHKPLLSSLKEGVWTPLACSLSTVFFALPIWCYLLSPQPPSPAAFHIGPCPYRTLAECSKMVSVWAAVVQGQVFMMYQTVNLSLTTVKQRWLYSGILPLYLSTSLNYKSKLYIACLFSKHSYTWRILDLRISDYSCSHFPFA